MSITLDELFTLFEEVEKSGILFEKREVITEKGKVLNLPRLYLSEDFGKEATVDREELVRLVQSATAGGADAFDRLKILNDQMQNFKKGLLGPVRTPSRILSQIMLLETFNRLFKSFGASPAGFINEGILSAFYEGFQEDAIEANQKFEIGDVKDSQGNPISIKTKTINKPIVDGSIFNLYNSINNSPNKKVIFDIYIKETTAKTKDGGGEVGTLTAYRFEVNADNINQFLGKNIFIKNEDGTVKPRFQIKKQKPKEDKEQINEAVMTSESANDFISFLLSKDLEELEKTDVSTSALPALWIDAGLQKISFGPGNINKIYGALEDRFKQISRKAEDREVREKAELLTKKFGSAELPDDGEIPEPQLGQTDTLTETEFKLTLNQWKPFARKFGKQPVVIKFSDEDLSAILEKAVQELNADIVDMFNTLQIYTTKLQEYLTSVAQNRNEAAKIAQSTAKQLPEKTDAVVLAAGVNEK